MTSGIVDRVALGFLDTVALQILVLLPTLFQDISSPTFLPALAEALPICFKRWPSRSASYVVERTTNCLLLSENIQFPKKSLLPISVASAWIFIVPEEWDPLKLSLTALDFLYIAFNKLASKHFRLLLPRLGSLKVLQKMPSLPNKPKLPRMRRLPTLPGLPGLPKLPR